MHSGILPIPEYLAKQFAGHAYGATFDLYVGYDEWELVESLHNLITFQTPFRA